MPFYLYEIKGNTCIQGRKRSLLPVVKDFAVTQVRKGNRRWHARKEDLLRGMGVEAFEMYAVIIDMKPDMPKNVSLYEVEDIWGFSSDGWTPLALRLKPLFVDHQDENPDRFKKRFTMPSAKAIADNGRAIHEFLYSGHADGVEGRWRWGRNGAVNATLLWPEAFEYFVSSIRERMCRDKVPVAVRA